MKSFIKKILSFSLLSFVVMGFVPSTNFVADYAYAQSHMCNPGGTSGNVHGYAMTDHLGPIYLSSQTWNEDPLGVGHTPTAQTFGVSFDRSSQTWNGRAWNPYVGWVDFGYTDPQLRGQKKARLEAPAANPALWGGLEPIINLAQLNYEVDPGVFVGQGTNGNFSVVGGSGTMDNLVGARYVDFSNARIDLENEDCNERVDVLLNGVTTLHRAQCGTSANPFRPIIQWSTQDVTNCIASAGSLWSGQKQNSGSELSGNITENLQPVTFRLSCIGIESGETVYGDAIASCGQPTDPGEPGGGNGPVIIDPTTGLPIPDFKEV